LATSGAGRSAARRDQPVPPGINWDLFLGPAPDAPFSVNRFKYNWHWFWDTGNGDIGNQGVHEMDMCRWGLDDIGLPNEACTPPAASSRMTTDQETPNTQLATFDYGNLQIVFEVRGLITGDEGGLRRRGEHTHRATSITEATATWWWMSAASRSIRATSSKRSWTRNRPKPSGPPRLTWRTC